MRCSHFAFELSAALGPNCVRYWVAKFSGEAGLGPKGVGALAVENQRLRKENARPLPKGIIPRVRYSLFVMIRAQSPGTLWL
jgi:hypothetical protein